MKKYYTLALTLPDTEYNSMMGISYDEDDLNYRDYSFKIARLNKRGRTVRMLDSREKYSGNNLESITFAYFDIRKEYLIKNGKETSKNIYCIYQGENEDTMRFYTFAKTPYDAHTKCFERLKTILQKVVNELHFDHVMVHPYFTDTKVRTLEIGDRKS